MRIELPEGYVPPQPTHPHYGYLTPQERRDLEAAERQPVVIVPGVEPPAETGTGPDAGPGEAAGGEAGEAGEVKEAGEVEVEEADEARKVRTRPTGWVPAAPSPPTVSAEPTSPGRAAPDEVEPATTYAEMRWDAYRQQWVAAEEADPPPDVAAAAGGRGSSSSWTSADGQRFRWDARAQQWVTERPEG